jgi:uncharacterized repeat protein (TIGR01451 family)
LVVKRAWWCAGLLALVSGAAVAQVEVKDPSPAVPSSVEAVNTIFGPDAFGYRGFDQAEMQCPLQFVDISATGTLVVSGDDVGASVNLPGPAFNFYGTTFSTLAAATNGYLSTDPTDTGPDLSNDCPLPATPSTGGGARIYPLHDDLVGDVLFQYFPACPRPSGWGAAEGCYVFQWNNMTHFGGGGPFSFQAILYDTSFGIVFQHGAGNPELGSGSTTGLQNAGATVGLNYACNTAASVPANGAQCIYHPSFPFGSGVAPAIELSKTVGTTPGVCAGTNSATITAGETVYYCFSATNTGNVAFDLHELVDDQLGTILSDFPFTLAPGASSPEVIVPATPSATVTNTATWTASTFEPFNYLPINATGTALNLVDDGHANITLPFSLNLFGVTSPNLRIGNNGGILFGATTGTVGFSNGSLPRPTPANAILPFWDDLDADSGNVYWQVQGTAPNRVAIVEWFQRSHFNTAPASNVTFQVLMYEGSNRVVFQYLDVDFGNPAFNNGASATVGLNQNATTATQISFNTPSIQPNSAIGFPSGALSASSMASATVTVLIPNIDVSPASVSATAPAGQSTTQPLTISNTGQGNLNWQIAEEPAPIPGEAQTPAGTGDQVAEVVTAEDLKPGAGNVASPHIGPIWNAPQGGVLFDNGALVTNPGAGSGGADVSALQTALGLDTLGFGHQVTAGNRVADDITVTGAGWFINQITFFAYQTGSTTTSTITSVNLRIWDGPPGAPGSNVIFGDTTTNRLASSVFSGIYRTVDTDLTATNRPLMANTVNVGVFLPAGTYWLDWQTGGSLASGPWAPPVSILGQTSKPGANALQFTGAWAPARDGGTGTVQQDFPFVIQGPTDCTMLADVPWLSVAPTSGTTVGGSSTPITVSFNGVGLLPGTYNARLCVTSNDPDQVVGNGGVLVVVPVSFTIDPSADLAMTLTDAPDPVTAGTNLTYTATVTNQGPTFGNDVSFTLPLPAGTSFVSATPSAGGTCNAASPVTCTWAGQTASGASRSATIVALVAANVAEGTVLSATATASSPTFDPNPANNSATTTTTVNTRADLAIALTASVPQADLGQTVTFTATSTNLGPSDAQNVVLSITLSPDFRYGSFAASAGGVCTAPQIGTTGVISCTWAGATAPGAVRTLAVDAASFSPGTSSIQAATSSDTTDPVPQSNNVASVSVLVGSPIEPIPTLSQWGLALLTLLVGLIGVAMVRRD